MSEDQLVLIDTAKLAVELGFDELCIAPTQTKLQKWLREKHRINVEANFFPNIQKYRALFKPMDIMGKNYDTYKKYDNDVKMYYSINRHSLYEDALEEGLMEGLNVLKNKNMIEDPIVVLGSLRDLIGKTVRVIKEDPMDEKLGVERDNRWLIGDEFVIAKIEILPRGCFFFKNDKQNLNFKRGKIL